MDEKLSYLLVVFGPIRFDKVLCLSSLFSTALRNFIDLLRCCFSTTSVATLYHQECALLLYRFLRPFQERSHLYHMGLSICIERNCTNVTHPPPFHRPPARATRRVSFPAPVVISPKSIFSAARPPEHCCDLFDGYDLVSWVLSTDSVIVCQRHPTRNRWGTMHWINMWLSK